MALTFPIWRYTTFTEDNVCLEDWGHEASNDKSEELICSGRKITFEDDDFSFPFDYSANSAAIPSDEYLSEDRTLRLQRSAEFNPFTWSKFDFNCSYADMENELFKEFCDKQHQICNKRDDGCTQIAGNECACHTSKSALQVITY